MRTPSGKATIFETDLVEGHFGRIWIRKDPMRIEINKRIAPVRATISLIHELLHMGEELLKFPLNHVVLHRVATNLYSYARDLFYYKGRRLPYELVEDIVEKAFKRAGRPLSAETELPVWSSYIENEVAPTVREYTRRRHGHQ